ncbi:MAG: CsgG/HfaB family protein [Treponema sp.]|nr:CsgG/HfaB family protein [Treponema sp.]
MKKCLMIFVFILSPVVLFAQQMNLDEVIKHSARVIEDTFPQGAKVLVLNFSSPSETFSEFVLEELSGELLEGYKITVVDRRNLSAIREELDFQYSGEVSDESMQSLGKMLGAEVVISGSLTDLGTSYRFRIRIINVETATVQRQITSELQRNDSQVTFLLTGKIEKPPKPPFVQSASIRNNWFSAEATLGLVGLRYERILNNNWALNFNGYAQWWGTVFMDVGIDVTARFYPSGKIFYMGIGMGGHGYSDYSGRTTEVKRVESSEETIYQFGFAICPEIGFKVHFGRNGGFFFDLGYKNPLLINKYGFTFNTVPHFGLGWAW